MKSKTARILQFMIDKGDWVFVYDMAKEMYGDTMRAAWKAGGMYPDLAVLQRDGYIESRWDPTSEAGHPRRRQYRAIGSKSVDGMREIARASRKKRRLRISLPWRRPSTT